ncbi:MAG: metallophosphoesterase family protein [Cognatishimia sp.]|uniref:metallophosphoesterase family protein n=1 Tax=Cognatishimia sp. TaxID=2211648 RepID=UPI003B8DF763
MYILDLGRLDTPVLLFGGPYSNLQASQALLKFAKENGFKPERVICTGDLVAYCARPAETVALWREFGCAILEGNCEQQLADYAMDCGCGFESGTTCDLLSAGWFTHADQQIDAATREWMGTLPAMMRFEHHGKIYAVVHGGATANNRFLWPVSAGADFMEEFQAIEAQIGPVDAVISGHSGIAFEKQIGAKTWINAGAIGLPRNDTNLDTEFAVLDGSSVTFHRLAYDWQGALRDMQAAGLTQGYHDTLKTGLWPSEDVLPMEMRRRKS